MTKIAQNSTLVCTSCKQSTSTSATTSNQSGEKKIHAEGRLRWKENEKDREEDEDARKYLFHSS